MVQAFPFALVSLIGTGAYLAALLALHVLPTGYDPIRHAVSDYAVGPFARWFTLGLWSSSLSVLTLAVGLGLAVGAPTLKTRDLVFLGLVALTRVGMSVFPTTLERDTITRVGALHYAFAIVAFTFTYLAIAGLSTPLKTLSPWHSVRGPLSWLDVVVAPALALVVVTMIGPLRRVFGLFERVFLLTTNLWFVLVASLLVVKTA